METCGLQHHLINGLQFLVRLSRVGNGSWPPLKEKASENHSGVETASCELEYKRLPWR
jgi:hypothetical protein